MVYVWYMLGIPKWPKELTMTEHVWSDFTDFGISAVHKKNWYMDGYTAFFVIQTVFSIPEATRNDYFWLVYNWYMASWYTYKDLFFAVIPLYDISKFNEVIGIGTIIHNFMDIKGYFDSLPQVTLNLLSSKVFLFSPEVFHQSCGWKHMIFEDLLEIHQPNWHQIGKSIDVLESNALVIENSRCIDPEKKKYVFPQRGQVNCAVKCHVTDDLIDKTTQVEESLDNDFATSSKICCPCVCSQSFWISESTSPLA